MGVETELYFKPWTLFWMIQSLGLLLFVAGLFYKFAFYFRGQKVSLYRKPLYSLMAKGFFRDVVIQKQLAQRSASIWFMHLAIVYGFVGLMLLSAIAIVIKIIPEGSYLFQYMTEGQGFSYYKLAGDLFGLFILIGLIMAFWRRFLIKASQLHSDFNDTIALVLLLLLVITGFLLEAMRISLSAYSPDLQYSFIGYPLANLFKGKEGIEALASSFWVFHASINALFFAYLPHSKFMHIIVSPIEVILNASEERMRGDLYI